MAAFKVPSIEEMEQMQRNKGHEVPSHFKSGKIAIAVDCPSSRTGIVDSLQKQTFPTNNSKSQPATAGETNKTSIQTIQPVPRSKASVSVHQVGNSAINSEQEAGSATISAQIGISGSNSAQPQPTESVTTVSSRPPKTNSIIVSPRQRGNPILKFVRSVPWEYGDIVPDYQINSTSCVLYLSLRYHNLNPNYIHERLKQLANSFSLRIILVQVDVKDPHHALNELAKVCILADCTLILAFTPEEAGRYLETYKSFENKPPDLIMEKVESNYLAKLTDTLTSTKKVNKTDAVTLLSAFGSFDKIVEASEEDLSLCPGFGPQKASRLHKVFHQPFRKEVKKPEDGVAGKEAKS